MDTTRAKTRSRRSVLAAAAAATGALAVQGLARPAPVSAANVVLGAVNTTNHVTTIRNTQASNSAKAIVGLVTYTGPGGPTVGVQGQSNAANGTGVFGVAAVGGTRGVWGRSVGGRGVYGEATGTSGTNYGVYGESKSTGGTGVYGTGGNRGLWGAGTTGIRGDGTSIGVYGQGANYGLAGTSSSVGVYGSSPAYGVYGNSAGTGVYGSGNDYGVRGFGETHGVSGTGTIYGVRGISANWAGYFTGKVHVAGVLSKSSGTFLIDHPLDPPNRTLAHSFVEAPEMLNIYRGTATLDARGQALVRLPRYFGALNTEFAYQLTAIGVQAPGLYVARKIANNRFRIAGGAPGQEVCWQVTGVRQDAWAKAHPLRVDRAKPRRDRGKYLNPEVFGKPGSSAIHETPRTVRRRGKLAEQQSGK